MCVCVCVCVSGSCVCVCVCVCLGAVCVCGGGGTCFFMPVFWLVLPWKCHEEAALSPAGGEKEGSPLPWTTGCSPEDQLYAQRLSVCTTGVMPVPLTTQGGGVK